MTTYEQGSGAGVAPYTRTGDDGTTTLGNLHRVPKSDTRIGAYAACEEANAMIGVTLASADLSAELVTVIGRLQNDLIEVQGDLVTPLKQNGDSQARIDDGYVQRVEEACGHYNDSLPVLETVVLPGGTQAGALLYQAGTMVRRAERMTWTAHEQHGDVNEIIGRYLNRMADLLFILGRVANAEHGDSTWVPGLTTKAGSLLPPPPESSGPPEG